MDQSVSNFESAKQDPEENTACNALIDLSVQLKTKQI